MNKFIYFILLLFFFASCEREEGSFANTFEIKLHPLDSAIHLVRPIDLEYLSDWLVWQDHYEGRFYSGYQINSKKLVRFAKVGKAKGEFEMWPQGTPSPFGLCLFNNDTKEFQRWNLDSILNNADYFPVSNLTIADSSRLTFRMIQRKDSSFLSTGPNQYGLFAFFDRHGNFTGFSGWYPEKPVQVSDQIHANACLNSTYTFHAGLDRVVIGYLFSGQFDVFQLQENEAIRLWSINEFPFEYKVSNGTVRIPLSTKYGFVDLDCTDKYIYALFSGKTRDADQPTHSSSVEVYDWMGGRVAKFELSTPLSLIAISPDNRYIYGTGMEQNAIRLFSAELPPIENTVAFRTH